jgi:hypothetical protein
VSYSTERNNNNCAPAARVAPDGHFFGATYLFELRLLSLLGPPLIFSKKSCSGALAGGSHLA